MVTPGRGAAFLRELADMLDIVPGLPEPFTITAQASVSGIVAGRIQSERFARVHDVAELLGVAVHTDYRGGRYARYGTGQFSYLLYASPDRLVDHAPLDSREREQTWAVTREQDEALAATFSPVRERARQDAGRYAARLVGALHARGLELSPTTLTMITQGDSSV